MIPLSMRCNTVAKRTVLFVFEKLVILQFITFASSCMETEEHKETKRNVAIMIV
jgi:hypothetical protein